MKAKNRLNIILGLALFSFLLAAQGIETPAVELNAQQVIDKTIEKYQQLDNLSIAGDITIEARAEQRQSTSVISFSLKFQRPDKIAFVTNFEEKSLSTISDGKDIYLYLEGLKEYTKTRAPKVLSKKTLEKAHTPAWRALSSLGAINHFILSDNPLKELLGKNYKATLLPSVVVDKVECYSVLLEPSSAAKKIDSLKLVVGKADFLLRQVEQAVALSPTSSARLTEKFGQVKTEPLLASVFEFQAPPDARLVKRFSTSPPEKKQLGPAPNFKLPDLNGKMYELASYKGQKIVVLNFWASWCKPCIKELPMIEEFYEKYKEKDVLVLGINNERNIDKVKSTVQKLKLTFPILSDPERNVYELYKIIGIPRTFVITKQGEIVEDFTGIIPEHILLDAIKKAGVSD